MSPSPSGDGESRSGPPHGSPRDAAGRSADTEPHDVESADAAPSVSLRHRAEYVALRAFAGAVRLLGYRGGRFLARTLVPLYCLADARHVRIAEANLRERLGLAPDAAARTARANYRHLFESIVEIFLLDREVARRGFDAVVAVEGMEHMDAALAAGRGVVLCTAHLGNWEAVARLARERGWKLTTIYRPLDNPLLDRWVAEYRREHGQEMAPKEGAIRNMLRALRGGGIGALLVDQDARRHGVFVPFFGRPASTIPTPAELALRTGAAIITVWTERTGPGFRHVVRFEPALSVAPGDHRADRDAEVVRIMTEINRRLECAVRRAPEQWFWPHRRWKSSPPESPGEGTHA